MILVVDDDTANLRLEEIVRESEGFDVATAVDAISALDVLRRASRR
jgi:CheY-like chemotaxis protein